MAKSTNNLMKNLKSSEKKIQDKTIVLEKQICYVLITCEKPNKEGNMNVEMKYEGDKFLASYLIQSAQGMLDE